MKHMNIMQILARFGSYVLRHKGMAVSISFFIIIQAVLSRALPFLIGRAIDLGIMKKDLQVVMHLGFYYLIAQVLASVINYVQHVTFQRLGNRVLFNLREDLISRVQSLPVKYFDKNSSGRIITRVTNDIGSVGGFFDQVLFNLVNSTIECIAILVSLLLISPRLTIVSLVFSPIIASFALKITHIIRDVFHRQKQKIAAINSFVAENISGISILHLYNRIATNRKRFNVLSQDYKNESLNMVHNYALLWPLTSIFNASCILLALLYGGYLNSHQIIEIGSLIAFLLHLQDLNEPINNLLEKYVQLQDSLTSSERVFDLLDEQSEDLLGAQPENFLSGKITIKDLSFRYADDLPWILKNINLEIKPGENIGIVGHTGSGKSTLISLLQKFYPYSQGQILVDDIPLSSLQSRFFRSQIGVIQQDPFIFRGTIFENIRLHNSTIPDDKILDAAKITRCQEIFAGRPDQLHTFIEEKGANLSAGERQLIAFARILAFDPKILILDEATANIDSHTESLIQSAIKKVSQGRTCIIVAHRLSTLRACDRIVVIDDHQIAEVGTHEELMKRNGIYFNLHSQHFTTETAPMN